MEAAENLVDEKVLVFQAGSAFLGIALDRVFAVTECPVSLLRKGAPGRYTFRGQELSVIDLAHWLGWQHVTGGLPSMLIIGRQKALMAARVDSPGIVVTSPEKYTWPKLCRPLVKGVFKEVMIDGGRLILILDPEGLYDAVNRESDHDCQGGGGQ